MIDAKVCKTCGQSKSAEAFKHGRRVCKKCCNNLAIEWRRANPEKAKSIVKKSREAHKDSHNAKRREWIKTDKARAMRKAWYERNKEAVLLYNRARKTMRRGMRANVTVERINTLLSLQKRKCAVCAADLDDGYHVDHIMPIALGGDSAPGNLQLLCPHCNCSKKAAHPVDFMQRHGRLL